MIQKRQPKAIIEMFGQIYFKPANSFRLPHASVCVFRLPLNRNVMHFTSFSIKVYLWYRDQSGYFGTNDTTQYELSSGNILNEG